MPSFDTPRDACGFYDFAIADLSQHGESREIADTLIALIDRLRAPTANQEPHFTEVVVFYMAEYLARERQISILDWFEDMKEMWATNETEAA